MAQPPASPGRGAAFFDLDKTLMQGSSAFQFARTVREAGLISRRQLAADALANLRFRLRGASDADSEALRDRIAASLEGVRVRDLERLGVRLLARILPRLYPRMLKIAYEHQDAGRPVYIVTAAAQGLADVLAGVLAFDGAVGSTLGAVRDGVYTGEAAGQFLYRDAKAHALARLAAEHGFDLSASYAYSD
ncbi:MAG TPA: HAD-IB family hydrolase, partial [Solirubrobacteraceae bacterium]|nr:HAD-IB family hydrolase [Solirubrobacteraceae bacterium]